MEYCWLDNSSGHPHRGGCKSSKDFSWSHPSFLSLTAEIADQLGKHLSVGPQPASYRSPSALDLLLNSATAYVCVSCCLLTIRHGVLQWRGLEPCATWDTRRVRELQHRNCRQLQNWVLLKVGNNSNALKQIVQHKTFAGRAWFSLVTLGRTWLFHTGPNSGIQFKTTNLSDCIYMQKASWAQLSCPCMYLPGTTLNVLWYPESCTGLQNKCCRT